MIRRVVEHARDEQSSGFVGVLSDRAERRRGQPAQQHVVIADHRHIAWAPTARRGGARGSRRAR